jgi:hypothetical protein
MGWAFATVIERLGSWVRVTIDITSQVIVARFGRTSLSVHMQRALSDIPVKSRITYHDSRIVRTASQRRRHLNNIYSNSAKCRYQLRVYVRFFHLKTSQFQSNDNAPSVCQVNVTQELLTPSVFSDSAWRPSCKTSELSVKSAEPRGYEGISEQYEEV